MKRVLAAAILLLCSASSQARTFSALDHLRARHDKERRDLLADQKLKLDRFLAVASEDEHFFQASQKAKKRDFIEAGKEAERALAAGLQGVSKDQHKLKWAEFKAKRRQELDDLKRRQAQERAEFYRERQAKLDYFKRAQGEERRILDEKQSSEIKNLKS